MNFEEVYNEYLLFARKQQKKQSFNTLAYNFNSKILPHFKNMNLEEITSNTIINWQDYILSLNYSNNYNRGLYYLLSGFFEFCHIRYSFDKSVITDVGCFKRKYEEKKTDFYNLQEFNKFIKCVDNNIYKQFFNLMFYTGTRPGEAMALKFSDLHNGYINISKTIESHGKREIGTPKTFSSIRNIKIDKILERDLFALKKYYEERYKLGIDYYIFGGIKPLSPTTINRHKYKACEKANMRPITLHQFRHSHATLLIQNNMLINEVSRRLGHSKVSTTLNVYTHTDLEQEKRVYNTLNSIRFNFFNTLAYIFKINLFQRSKSR